MMANFVRTENANEDLQREFMESSSSGLYEEGSKTYSIKTRMNDVESIFMVHRSIIAKCRIIQRQIDDGFKNIIIPSESNAMTKFLRLLYGFNMKLTSNEVFDTWVLALECGYDKIHILERLLLTNDTSTDVKLALLSGNKMDKLKIITACTLKQINELLEPNVVNDLETLRLLGKEVCIRYKTNTTLQKEFYENKLAEQAKIVEQNQAKQSSLPANSLGNLGNLGSQLNMREKSDYLADLFAKTGKF